MNIVFCINTNTIQIQTQTHKYKYKILFLRNLQILNTDVDPCEHSVLYKYKYHTDTNTQTQIQNIVPTHFKHRRRSLLRSVLYITTLKYPSLVEQTIRGHFQSPANNTLLQYNTIQYNAIRYNTGHFLSPANNTLLGLTSDHHSVAHKKTSSYFLQEFFEAAFLILFCAYFYGFFLQTKLSLRGIF